MNQTATIQILGLGELHVSADPSTTLACLGLGSCVALCLYDPMAHAGGMAHMVLPSSGEGRGSNGAKFVDIGSSLLVEEVEKLGGKRWRLIAKLVGGAQMVAHASGSLNIGERNGEAAKAALEHLGVRLAGSDLGGRHGRTVRLFLDTGLLTVSTTGGESHEL